MPRPRDGVPARAFIRKRRPTLRPHLFAAQSTHQDVAGALARRYNRYMIRTALVIAVAAAAGLGGGGPEWPAGIDAASAAELRAALESFVRLGAPGRRA